MITKSFVIRPSLLLMSTGVLLFASGDRCLSQDAEQKENQVRQIQIVLGAEGLDVVSPAIKKQISQQIDFLAQQGNDVQQLRELIERLQLTLENSEQRTTRDVEVAVFSVPEAGKEGPEGSPQAGPPRAGISFTGPPPAGAPGFGPPGLQMEGRAALHPGQSPQIHHPEAHSPEGPFAEDRRRIAALTESAERLAGAGLPDLAHGLRERAGQLERELAEKQERMQQEKRQRAEAEMRERQEQARQQPQPHQPQRLMEQRREGIERGDHPAPPLRELHEQMEQLRRDMHKLSEQMADLTRLIQQHHHPRTDRGHHDDGNDEADDQDDDEMEDEDDEDDEEMDDDDHRERDEHAKE